MLRDVQNNDGKKIRVEEQTVRGSAEGARRVV
jgi:hypothetical protein